MLDIKNLTVGVYTTISPQFVGSFSGTLPSLTTARSYTIALNDSALSYDHAEITMPINGTVNRVLHCTSWNFTVGSCSNWESNSTFNYPGAVVNATHLIFNATRFDAYAGGYLEATPTPTPTPTPTSTSAAAGGAAGAGGGGGGGGGAGGPALPTKKVTASSDEQVPVKIAVSLKSDATSPSVKITAGGSPSSSGIPAPQGDAVYHYLDITKTNFNNSDIETATIEFEVNLSWISENGINNVYLARYENGSGSWKKLRTELVNSTQFSNSYKAYTDGFSDFAIVGEKAKPLGSVANPGVTGTPTAVATTGTTPSVGGTPSPTPGANTGMTNGNKNSLPWTQIGILLAVIVIVAIVWSLRASLLSARHTHTTNAANVTAAVEKTQAAEETPSPVDETPEAPTEKEK